MWGSGVGIRNLGLEMGRFLGKKPVMRVLAAASCFSHWTLMFPGEGARPKEDYAMSLATPEASSASGQLKSLQVPVPTVAPVPPTPTAKETVGSSQTPVLEGLPPLGTSPLLSQGACGHRTLGIIGGKPAPERKWPWQVSLQLRGRHRCGGSLIAPQWVLTAAHLCEGILSFHSFREFTVMMGTTYLYSHCKTTVVVPVKHIKSHKDFDWNLTPNDIALLQLAHSVNYSAYIQPVCLPRKNFEVRPGTQCWITGWGRTLEFDPASMSPKLQEAEQLIIPLKQCAVMVEKTSNKSGNRVQKGMVCAQNIKSEDSGSPLVCQFQTSWIQVGIVSWGDHCGLKEVPAVYTDVSFYKDWITARMSQASGLDSGFLILLLCLLLPLGILATL
uniref:Peptidase S1 domain-containing protein n=1 Tax=Bos mutus grunniens TaxID=30521 RepID=A0A8B9XF21_BOSMU